MSFEVYGIPNCGTCKKACQWLTAQGIEYSFVNYREDPPSVSSISAWVAQLGTKALKNTSGQSYRQLGPERQDWSDEQWIQAFAHDPMLIKRPVIVKDQEAIAAGFRLKEADLKRKLGI
ncbi:arsenate reductase family protein [Gloeocapsa sp. PCC 73106]|uniref:arsenate reductase family protein n=1 Tax=Gloeocapsa sp. PCC 73106 TaxID=102232 RepID=UPI0002ACA3CB|nr:Spx/MgsR family RNA polymerase-binding regulatory protein [Gloeocapsa sp. PCC 73106]ELR99430.1 transcriptional regulator, Spx/MgsR family [Gloeocapsa sp. PCC 73106]